MASPARPLAPARRPVLLTSLLPAIVLALTVLTPHAAFAQSGAPTPVELRRENEALRERVAQLEAELRSATDTIESLREQMDQLSTQLESLRLELRRRGTDAPAAPEAPSRPEPVFADVPIDEPLSSPEAMFRAMVESYSDALGELPYETDAEYRRYVSELSRWTRLVRRELRGQAEWVIQATGVTRDDARGLVINYRVIDPESRLPFADRQFELELPRGTAQRRFRDHPDHELWLVRGRLFGKPDINPDREEMGFFDVPRFIGPFAEFGFDLRLEAFVRVADPEEIAEMQRERRERERDQRERDDATDEEIGPTGRESDRRSDK